MDTIWLKKSLKSAGKTTADLAEAINRDRAVVSRILNGRQSASIEQAKHFAAVLDRPVSEVLEKLGLTDAATAKIFQPGFAEGDAAEFVFSTAASADPARTVAIALGADRPGVDTWTVKSDAMVLSGFLPGDLMLVDTRSAEICKAGDAVIAQTYDWQTGSATTLLRRYEPPVLVASTSNSDMHRVIVLDGHNTVVRGKVIATWRLY